MSIVVPYSHMAGFIISGYRPLYISLFNKDLSFTFEDYVKCNMHMPFMLDLHGRDSMTFYNTLKFIQGEDKYFIECGTTLRWFYSDMLDMLCSVLKHEPKLNHKIDIKVRFGREILFPKKSYQLESVKKELEGILFGNAEFSGNGLGGGVLVRFSDSEVDSLVPNNMLALASILSQFSYTETEPAILEVL